MHFPLKSCRIGNASSPKISLFATVLITHRFCFPLPQLLTLSNQSNQSWILYFSWALTHGKQVAQVAHDLRVLFLFTQSWVKSAFFRKTQHCWLWLSLQSTTVWSITHKHWKLLQFTSFIAKPKKYISVIAEPANDQKSTPARFFFLVPQPSPTSHSLLQQTPRGTPPVALSYPAISLPTELLEAWSGRFSYALVSALHDKLLYCPVENKLRVSLHFIISFWKRYSHCMTSVSIL